MDSASQQSPDGNIEDLACQVPECDVNAGDGIDSYALSTVGHRGAPHDVPQALDVERVLAHQQLGQVILDDHASAGAPRAVSLHALIGADLDPEATSAGTVSSEQAAHGLVLGIDRDRICDFDTSGGPRARGWFVSRHGPLGPHCHEPHSRDPQVIFDKGGGSGQQLCRRCARGKLENGASVHGVLHYWSARRSDARIVPLTWVRVADKAEAWGARLVASGTRSRWRSATRAHPHPGPRFPVSPHGSVVGRRRPTALQEAKLPKPS